MEDILADTPVQDILAADHTPAEGILLVADSPEEHILPELDSLAARSLAGHTVAVGRTVAVDRTEACRRVNQNSPPSWANTFCAGQQPSNSPA